tara:strand:- start:2009 stop:2812 length:804 start_codon:yes stop_codon:yes gene_type:complete
MRILLVIDETYFFHPKYVNQLCEILKEEIVGCLLVTKIKDKNSLEKYLLKNFFKLRITESILLFIKKIILFLSDVMFKVFNVGKPSSVRSVINFHKIKFVEVEHDINQEKYVDFIKNQKPNLIISSNSLYFGSAILNQENLLCINRHSAYLPNNGGTWPVFYSISKNENYTGVTIHLMNSKIDTGEIITQKKILLNTKNLYDLYKKCFEESLGLTIEAVDKIRENNNHQNSKKKVNKILYNSFPKNEDWDKFRKNGGTFINFKNLFN